MSDKHTVNASRLRLALWAGPVWMAGLIMPTATQAFDCANGLYVQASSLQPAPGKASTSELLDHARSAGVRYILLYGQGIEKPAANVAEFMASARVALGNVRMIVMLARKVCTAGLDVQCFNLDDDKARDRLAKQALSLWQQGYDGVQLDLEPIASGNRSLLDLLARVKGLKPSGKLLSIAGFSLALEGPIERQLQQSPKGPGTLRIWDHNYYRQVLSLVGQVVVMN